MHAEAFLKGYMNKEAALDELLDDYLPGKSEWDSSRDKYDPLIEDALKGRERDQYEAWDHTAASDLGDISKNVGWGASLGAGLGALRKDESEDSPGAALTGAIRGAGAGLGAGLTLTGTRALTELLGSNTRGKQGYLKALSLLLGGAGGYALTKKLTKTPAEEAKEGASKINKISDSRKREELVNRLTQERIN
jgi:hypothetical protein